MSEDMDVALAKMVSTKQAAAAIQYQKHPMALRNCARYRAAPGSNS
jgi:hypothetical protein